MRLHSAGKLYPADTGELEVKRGDRVVIQLDRGQALGRVVRLDTERPSKAPANRVLRKAKDDDLAREQRNEQRARSAIKLTQEKLKRRRIDVPLVRAEYLLDGSRVEIFYLAEDRHLPNDLANELSIELKTEVELRAVGPRDRVKMAGAVGVCGRETCCSSFMEDFHPVSVKMAKIQDFSLNESRLMGVCGRLKCCLAYENAFYETVKRTLPKIGSFIETENGEGRVWSHLALKNAVQVRFEDGTQISIPVPAGGFPKPSRRPQPAPPVSEPPEAVDESIAELSPAPRAEEIRPEPAVAPRPVDVVPEPSVEGLAATEVTNDGDDERPEDGAVEPVGAGERNETDGERKRKRRRRRRRGGGPGQGPGGQGQGGPPPGAAGG